jgi:hypothetical protein
MQRKEKKQERRGSPSMEGDECKIFFPLSS